MANMGLIHGLPMSGQGLTETDSRAGRQAVRYIYIYIYICRESEREREREREKITTKEA